MAVSFLASDTLLNDYYRIVNPMTIGRTSTIYLATHTEIPHHKFGIRLLHPEYSANRAAVNRFRQGVMSLLRITHGGVLRPYDFVQTHGLVGIGMEFVDGVSLTHVMQSVGKLAIEQKMSLILQVCEALRAVHSAGVAHGNIGPRHIMVDSSQQVKLIDFSSARILNDPEMCENSNVLLRPSRYTSPEQRAGLAGDVRSDIFSLGAVAFELFLGRTFEGDLHELARGGKEAPEGINEVLLKALMARPAARFNSVGDFEKELRALSCERSSFIASGFSANPIPTGLPEPDSLDPQETLVVNHDTFRNFIPKLSLRVRMQASFAEFLRRSKRACLSLKRSSAQPETPPAGSPFLVKGLMVIAVCLCGALTMISLFLPEEGSASHVAEVLPKKDTQLPEQDVKTRMQIPVKKAHSGSNSNQPARSSKVIRVASDLASFLGESVSKHESSLNGGIVKTAASSRIPVRKAFTGKAFRRESVRAKERHHPAVSPPRQSFLSDMIALESLQQELALDRSGANLHTKVDSSSGPENLLQEMRFVRNPLVSDLLIDFSQSESYTIRIAALRAMRSRYHLSQATVQEALLKAMGDRDYLVRGFAARVLASDNSGTAHTALIEQLEVEKHPVVRRVIESALVHNTSKA